MKLILPVVGLLVGMALAGCGGPAKSPPPQASETSATAKKQILAFVETARTDPAGASQSIAPLVETLDGYAANQGGDQFKPVRDAAKELATAYSANPPDQARIASLLEGLTQKANALP